MSNAASGELDRALSAKKGKADGVRPIRSKSPAPKSLNAAQAVVKVISHARGFRVTTQLKYIAREEAKDKAADEPGLALEDEYGRQIEGIDAIEKLQKDWAKDFERAKPGQKNPPRHSTHMILSGDCENNPKNARIVLDAVRATLQSQLAENGYRFAFVLHTDRPNPHVHVVINNYHTDGGPKLRLNPPELAMLREEFAAQMRVRGLEQHATRKLDRVAAIEQGIQNLRDGGNWYDAKLFTASAQASQDAASRLQNIEATERMLEIAGNIEKQTGEAIGGTDFATVRAYLDKHNDRSGQIIGLDNEAPGDPAKPKKLGAFDAFAKRRAMSKTVTRLRAEVKATTLPFSAQRREQLAALNEIRAELIDRAAPDYMALADALEKKLNRQHGQVQGYIRDLAESTETPAQQKRRSAAIMRGIERNLKTVQETRLQLLRSGFEMTPAERHSLAQRLNEYEKKLKTLRRLHSLGLHEAAAPGTTAQINADKQAQQAARNLDRDLSRLEAAGAWHTPKNPRHAGRFDAFAKREGLAKSIARIEDSVETLAPAHKARIQIIKDRQIVAPSPSTAQHVAAVIEKAMDARETSIKAARAAYATGQSPEAAGIAKTEALATLRKAEKMIHRARRDLASDAAVPSQDKAGALSRLKRIEKGLGKAAKAAPQPLMLAVMLRDLGPARSQDRATLLTTKERDYATRRTADIGRALENLRAASRNLSAVERANFSPEQGARNIALGRTRQALATYLRQVGQDRAALAAQQQRVAPGTPSAAFSDHLERLHSALLQAGAWCSDTPYNSPTASRPRNGIELDSFAKRAAMLRDVERLRETLDAGRIDLDLVMRSRLKEVRTLADAIKTAPAKDMDNVITRLAQKVTDAQLQIEGAAAPKSAVELVQRRREAQRIADQNLNSIEAARAEIRRDPALRPEQRVTLEKRLQPMAKAMERHSSKGRGL